MKKDAIDHVNDCSHVRKCENNEQKDMLSHVIAMSMQV